MIVDDFSRYTLVMCLREKLEALCKFKTLCIKLKKEKFEFMGTIKSFSKNIGIHYDFFTPKTPQQNCIVER